MLTQTMNPTSENDLLAKALKAHGGLDRWRRFRGLESTIVTGGELWRIKGVDMPAIPRRVTTEFQRQSMRLTPFGKPEWTMTWVPERVAIEDEHGGIVAERSNPREAFSGHVYDTPWDPLHLAYFNGYAMWTYHALPFVLAEPGYEVIATHSIEHEGEPLEGITVRFPIGIHSHTRDQSFYFDADGLLRRHDYTVDVWDNERAAHFLSGYTERDGFMFPTRRSVFPRNPDGSLRTAFNTVTIEMSDYKLL